MQVFEITGGTPLSGTIQVSGSKNAATPIIAATLLSDQPSLLHNVPRIEDVFRMLEILESVGAQVAWVGDHSVQITPKNIDVRNLDQNIVKKLRSSILLLGPLSARFDQFSLHRPGGCVLGARSVDTHVDALSKLGVTVKRAGRGYTIVASERKSEKITLREASVTATENVLMLAAGMPGATEIHFAAAEPHVQDLCHFLVSMGVQIEGIGTHTLKVTGKPELEGATHTLIPDANESAAFLVLGAATKSQITVQAARPDHLEVVMEKLRQFGVNFEIDEKSITVLPTTKLIAVSKVETMIYPGLPTDSQAPFGVLATQAEGTTLIHDPMFESRFNYISELQKMGATAKVLNPHQVEITGPTTLHGTIITSFDLRSGMALIIAALCAEGITTIEEIYQVDRGYEEIEKRLQALGANIKRVER